MIFKIFIFHLFFIFSILPNRRADGNMKSESYEELIPVISSHKKRDAFAPLFV
ncbi:hypothetical protein HMPREF1863_00413, partial [Aedoeadaptatus coxii]